MQKTTYKQRRKVQNQQHRRDFKTLVDGNIRNFVLGLPHKGDWRRYGRIYETAHRWVQTQKVDIDGVKGTAIVDGFDFIDQPFCRLTRREVASAIANGAALLVTTQTNIKSPLITNLITDQIGIERLRHDLKEFFGLAVAMSFDNEGLCTRKEVLPLCRTKEWISFDIDKGHKSVIHVVGNQGGLQRLRRTGMSLSDPRTKLVGIFTETDTKGISELARQTATDFILDVFEIASGWGVQPQTESFEQQLVNAITA
jgi:hypothetical protein